MGNFRIENSDSTNDEELNREVDENKSYWISLFALHLIGSIVHVLDN